MADKIGRSTHSVSFKLGSQRSIFNFELNSELNDDMTTFFKGSNVFINCYNSGESEEVFSTNGNVMLYSEGTQKQIQEVLLFTNNNIVDVSYPILNVINYYWYGDSLGGIQFLDNQLKSTQTGYGVLIINYITVFNIYKFVAPSYVPIEDVPVLVYGYNNLNDEAFIPINLSIDELSDKDILIEAKDYDLDIVIPDADVYINGELKGKTNQDGIINLGKMRKGRYSLVIKKDGYKDTDLDALNNDYFVVE